MVSLLETGRLRLTMPEVALHRDRDRQPAEGQPGCRGFDLDYSGEQGSCARCPDGNHIAEGLLT